MSNENIIGLEYLEVLLTGTRDYYLVTNNDERISIG